MRDKEVYVSSSEHLWKLQGQPLQHRFLQNCDASQITWITQTKQTQTLFLNNEVLWEAPEFIGNPVWSPNGRRKAFAFADAKGVHVRVDDVTFGPYASLNLNSLIWSTDNQVCGWVTQRNNRSVVILNGEENILPVSKVQGGTLALSPDGSHWAVSARAGFLGLKGCVIADGQSGKTYNALGTSAPLWNSEATALAYFVAQGLKTTFIVCNGHEGQHCTSFIDGSLTWHSKANVVGCVAQKDGLPCVVLEGCDGDSWSFRPDGFLLKTEKVTFGEGRNLHDLAIRNDGTVFSWSTEF